MVAFHKSDLVRNDRLQDEDHSFHLQDEDRSFGLQLVPLGGGRNYHPVLILGVEEEEAGLPVCGCSSWYM